MKSKPRTCGKCGGRMAVREETPCKKCWESLTTRGVQ